MTDRELLEKAAKAAGIEIHASDDGTLQRRPIWAVYHYVQGQPYVEVEWNPLRDDAEALRLAVKLGIGVLFDLQESKVTAYQYGPQGNYYIEVAEDKTPSEATRLAIVRAAASIGETPNA